MNKIAICDNNPKAKEQIRKCCEKYDAKEGNINEYYEFSSGEDLLASSLHFDLMFLIIWTNHFGPHRLSMCYKRLSDIRSSWKQNLLFFEQQRE